MPDLCFQSLCRTGALVHQLSRKDIVTKHSGWQYTPSCARGKELSEQHNCSQNKRVALDPYYLK